MFDILDKLIVRDLVASLPRRERELAELLMAGHTQTTAARELRISGRAVRYRVRNIRRKFGGAGRPEPWVVQRANGTRAP